MGRSTRAKKLKNKKNGITIEESKLIAEKATYAMSKEMIERFYLILASWLTSPPYRWNRDKFLRLKKKLDRAFVGLMSGVFDKELYYENLIEKGFTREDITKMDIEDTEKYLNGEIE